MRRLLLLLLLAGAAAAADAWERLGAALALPPAEARTALERLLLDQPGFLPARFDLGTLLLEADPGTAAEHLQAATAAPDPELAADAWHNLALARVAQGRLEEALAAAEQAARLAPAVGVPLRDEVRRLALARRDEARRRAEEEARRLHLDPRPLPPAHVGEAYRARLPIAGGTPPASAALAGEGRLPQGLALEPDGTIAGTPRTAGRSDLAIALRDAAGATATGAAVLVVLPAPRILTERLPEAVVGEPYAARLAAEGLERPRWTVARLPAGLAADPDGRIHGTPTAAEDATLTVHAADGERSADRLLDLASAPFAPAEVDLPPATAGAAYRHRVTVRGPAQDYRWAASASAAAVAPGPDGLVSGTPGEAGMLPLPATISAADGRQRAVELRLPVNPAPLIQAQPITLEVGRAVDLPLPLAGGTPPIAWSRAGGELPAGIQLTPDGRLRGVAKDAGTFTATVAVSDAWQAATRAELAITVGPAQEPPPDQEGKDQPGKDQHGKDQQQGKDGKDQAGAEGKDGKDQQQGKDGKDGKDQAGAEGKDGKDQAEGRSGEPEGDAGRPAAASSQAATLDQTAADRWIDQLPAEDRDVLRYQLLDGGGAAPAPRGKAW